MVSCLILYHPTITSLTKCKILRAIFHEEDFEINVIENNSVVMYIWNIKKVVIWQVVMDFEVSNVLIGYGFGDRRREAHAEAMTRLDFRLESTGKELL